MANWKGSYGVMPHMVQSTVAGKTTKRPRAVSMPHPKMANQMMEGEPLRMAKGFGPADLGLKPSPALKRKY